MDHPSIHTLCTLRPFVALSRLLVTPVVALLTDVSVLEKLSPSKGEVDVIFDHQLEAMLEPPLSAQGQLVAINSELWPSEAEFYVCVFPHDIAISIHPTLELYGQPMDMDRRFDLPYAPLSFLCFCDQGPDCGDFG